MDFIPELDELVVLDDVRILRRHALRRFRGHELGLP